jgi:hypothetical protein
VDVFDLSARDLPLIFLPAEAASVLRGLGLAEMTECALRTRAYRKQVPFHLNGRRIIFTLGDLREIAEGETRKPAPRAESVAPGPAPRAAPRRRPAHQGSEAQPDPWRARGSHGLRANPDGGNRT